MKVIPAHDTIAELEQKAREYEEQSEGECAAIATRLREEAELFREWISALKARKWTS